MINDDYQTPGPRFASTAALLGIHPLCGATVAAVDFMCFGGELTTGFALTVVSLVVALALLVPIMLVQRYAYKDSWLLAFAKSCILTTLTAIPTALPSGLTLLWSVTGGVGLRYRATHQSPSPVIDADYEEVRDQPN